MHDTADYRIADVSVPLPKYLPRSHDMRYYNIFFADVSWDSLMTFYDDVQHDYEDASTYHI